MRVGLNLTGNIIFKVLQEWNGLIKLVQDEFDSRWTLGRLKIRIIVEDIAENTENSKWSIFEYEWIVLDFF